MGRTITTKSFPASFVRGGTSNGLIINRSNLPRDEAAWQPILSSAMGSPDAFGRQLNGLGQGISSTSKICVISRSDRQDADVDYTFVQVGIKGGDLDMAGNCGNMSSAVGPVAWDEGFVEDTDRIEGGEVTVRMYNRNTDKIIHSTFSVNDSGRYEPVGDYSIDGVSGTNSKITLSFLDPAGAKTGLTFPSAGNNKIDVLKLSDGSRIPASLIDVANPGIFVLASDVGVPGDITSDALASDEKMMARLDEIRREGTRLMGLDPDIQSVPKIVFLSKPTEQAAAQGTNIVARALSMQQAHKSIPLTLALNLGAACKIPGTIPAQTAINVAEQDSVVIAHASGKIEVGSVMKEGKIISALLHRTARVLMRGEVFYTIEDTG